MGHNKSKYLDWRRCYEPAHIKLIIVAESPPCNGKYFYNPDGSRGEILFRSMMKQINVTCSNKDEGLRKFQAKGWILVDATYEPVNDYHDEQRNNVVLQDYPQLCEDLARLTPDRSTPVILIKKNVCELLETRLVKDRFRVLNRGIKPPFPTYRPEQFRKKFDEILRSAAVTLGGAEKPLHPE